MSPWFRGAPRARRPSWNERLRLGTAFDGWHPCSAPPPITISRELVSVVSVPSGDSTGAAVSRTLRARAFDYQWTGPGALSLKCVFRGTADYTVSRVRRVVTPRSWLILNDEQTYEVTACDRTGVEMFVVFFARELVVESLRAIRRDADRLLDEPDSDAGGQVDFCERLLEVNPDLGASVRDLARAVRVPDLPAADEALRKLTARLLREEGWVIRESRRLSALRPGTRRELMKRLFRARDFAASCYGDPLRLSDLARVACLSPSHLLRSFREAFGMTPHQFIQRRRLLAAHHLLRTSGRSVTEICLQVGFESLGTFSTLFRQRFGIAPSALRKK